MNDYFLQEHRVGGFLQDDAATKLPFISAAAGGSFFRKEMVAVHEPPSSALASAVQPAAWQDYNGCCFELALGQRQSVIQSYSGVCSTYGAHQFMNGSRRKVLLQPAIAVGVEEPVAVYVNAKQLKGILRRRLARAKAARERRVSMKRKPYLHESRRLHAIRRARGSGGRFLNTRNVAGEHGKAAGGRAFAGFGGSNNLLGGDTVDSTTTSRAAQDPAGRFLSAMEGGGACDMLKV